MRLAQAAKPEDGSHAVELPAELIHRNRSLIAPLGSRILTFPENVIVGKLKTSTGPDVSGFRDGSVETGAPLQLPVPAVIEQPPFSSNIIVKARADANAKVSPMPRTANANAASAIRFMIVIPLNRPPQPRRSRRPRRCGCSGSSQFVRCDPSLPLVVRADERRRVKSGPDRVSPNPNGGLSWVRAGVASSLNYTPDR